MPFFGVPIRNGLPIGLGSVAGFGAPQEFTPAELFIGGTAGTWYDPSDLTTMFTTSAGTTPVAMPGGGAAVSVGRMLDKSGNGNHAIAINDTTARPELRARVNLLRWSEVFDATASGSVWVNTGVTVTDGALAPNGTNTADTITGTTGTYPNVRQTLSAVQLGTYKASCYFQKTSGATRFPAVEVNSAPQGAFVILNTNTGVATLAEGSATTITVSSDGNYWLLSFETSVTRTDPILYIYPASSSNGTSYAPNLTGSCVAWGADLRPANIGANVPAYQRIADANTYDTAGFPLYLWFDGIDDSMYTPANLNLSATDKVGVFAGVRKLSDATNQRIVELSANSASNTGTFQVIPVDWSGTGPNYAYSQRGTATLGLAMAAISPPSYAAPLTNVVTGFGDIAGDNSTLRINSAQVAVATGDQGSGNFGTYPLYIGSRANSSLWLNGQVYGLVVVGSAVSAGNISATESWMAQRTGIVIP